MKRKWHVALVYSLVSLCLVSLIGGCELQDHEIESLIAQVSDLNDAGIAAANQLAAIGKPAIPALIKALGDSDSSVRRGAIAALSKIGEPAVPALIGALGDYTSRVRLHAAWALGEGEVAKAAKKAVPALIMTLADEYEDVRATAAFSLGLIGEPAKVAVPALAEALGDERQQIRSVAAEALRRIGTAEAVVALEENGGMSLLK